MAALENSTEVNRVVLATDSEDIIQIAESFGLSKLEIYRRDAANAQDTSSTESVMLEYLEKSDIEDDDIFILVQATSPFTTSSDFDGGVKKFLKDDVDSVLSCARTKRFYWSKDGEPINYDPSKRPRRQDFDGQYIENGAFYINSVSNIKKDRNRLSGSVGVFEMPEFTSLELDEEHDWLMGELLFKKYNLTPAERANKVKLLICDIDGVLTDGSMYYTEYGDEIKRFNTYDGASFAELKSHGVLIGIMTGEDRELNKRRAKKLGVDHFYQNQKDKLSTLKGLCTELGIGLDEVAYIGDAHNDLLVLQAVGFAACPSNAYDFVKEIPGIFQLKTKGGDGVVREYLQYLKMMNAI